MAKAKKQKKIKIPKEVGGVKIPKEVRKEGEKLIAAATALVRTGAAGAMLKAAMTNVNVNSWPKPPRPPRPPRGDWDHDGR